MESDADQEFSGFDCRFRLHLLGVAGQHWPRVVKGLARPKLVAPFVVLLAGCGRVPGGSQSRSIVACVTTVMVQSWSLEVSRVQVRSGFSRLTHVALHIVSSKDHLHHLLPIQFKDDALGNWS